MPQDGHTRISKEHLESCPLPPCWMHLIPKNGDRNPDMMKQNISYPCIGSDGQGEAVRVMIPASTPVNVYDINPELKEVYMNRLGVATLDNERKQTEPWDANKHFINFFTHMSSRMPVYVYVYVLVHS